MDIKKGRWGAIKKACKTTGSAKPHGLKGRSQAIKDDDPRMIPIREHFAELMGLGEIRATRFVNAWVNGKLERVTRDDDNDEVYLPFSSEYRPMYYRYMNELGYIARPDAKGKIKVSNDETYEGHRMPYVCLRTYVTVWKRDYPKLKVSKAAEDICELCYRFANRHRFLAKHKCISPNDCNAGGDDDYFGYCFCRSCYEMDQGPSMQNATGDKTLVAKE